MGANLDQALGALNGAVGDYLSRTGNGLAFDMEFFHRGEPLPMTKDAIVGACPDPGPRAVVLVHGLMCTEHVWRLGDGSDYGSLLARDLGFSPFYVRYNSGLPIPDNGALLAARIAALVEAYPVPLEELLLVGYSMGGLVVRGACHAAATSEHAWLSRVRRAIYVGTPHLGAPLERGARAIARLLSAIDDPYTKLVVDLANLRSDGVKDLGDADLRHEDRARRTHGFGLRDPRHPVPLLPSIQHYLIAGSLSTDAWLSMVIGDPLVPVPSATDGACADAASFAIPPDHIRLLPGIAHMPLAHHLDVYAQIRAFCESVR